MDVFDGWGGGKRGGFDMGQRGTTFLPDLDLGRTPFLGSVHSLHPPWTSSPLPPVRGCLSQPRVTPFPTPPHPDR